MRPLRRQTLRGLAFKGLSSSVTPSAYLTSCLNEVSKAGKAHTLQVAFRELYLPRCSDLEWQGTVDVRGIVGGTGMDPGLRMKQSGTSSTWPRQVHQGPYDSKAPSL